VVDSRLHLWRCHWWLVDAVESIMRHQGPGVYVETIR
jgi:hypothetical protein